MGYAASRYLATVAAIAIIVFNSMVWSGHLAIATMSAPLAALFGLVPGLDRLADSWLIEHIDAFISAPFGHVLLTDAFNPMLIAPFAFGMLVAIWSKYVPVNGIAAVVLLAAAFYTYDHGNWNAIGQFGFLYFLMWAAISWTKLQHWEKYGDFSYGVYIFAWPLMMFCCYFGLQKAGMIAYFAVIVVATHIIAFASWHLIEKPAMSLKDWSPAPLLARLRRPQPSAVPDVLPDERVPALAGVTDD